MHPLLPILTCAYLLFFCLDVAAGVLNLRRMPDKRPDSLADLLTPGRYTLARNYLRVNTAWTLAVNGAGLALLLGVLFLGVLPRLDDSLPFAEISPVLHGLLFALLLFAAEQVVSIPPAIVETFVIEERFGFNTTTPATFAADRIKGAALTLLLGGAALALVLACFSRFPDLAWLVCWMLVALFLLLLHYVAPRWLMPLFLRFTPLPEGPLRAAIHELARACDFPLRRIDVVDGSRRSTKANAFFTGYGANRRIALFDTLVERHSQQEILAVLAHEIGHARYRHSLRMALFSIAATGLFFFLAGSILRSPFLLGLLGPGRHSLFLDLVTAYLLTRPLFHVIGIVFRWLSRRAEIQADRFAALMLGSPDPLAAGLRRLASANLAHVDPHPLHVVLHSTHPPLRERIRALENPAPSAS